MNAEQYPLNSARGHVRSMSFRKEEGDLGRRLQAVLYELHTASFLVNVVIKVH